mmetsp:Transcript_125239/g.286972  ORF Transcript_125239/g.286972 Transcript_125239/m.286972 type:complete len:83 (-) Transcript_125239:13-261(-)
MTTGMMDRITKSGRMTPIDEIPTPLFAVPYAAPRFAKTIAEVTPMKPKKADDGSHAAITVDAANMAESYRVVPAGREIERIP